MNLSRKQFIDICTKAILYTRTKITIANQLSGYRKYHREIKDNLYFFFNVRENIKQIDPEDYKSKHDLIEHVGLGKCREIAEFLLVEIANEINRQGSIVNIQVVKSATIDHVFLKIMTCLEGEKNYSVWEIDAWDPRIIDISPRPDGTIKNHESLEYGIASTLAPNIYSDVITQQESLHFFKTIPKPRPGRSDRDPTPEREMFKRNPSLYIDYSVEDAIGSGKIDPSGKMHYLQKVSTWQSLRSSP